MGIYTRRGDAGETGLYQPKGAERRVAKDDPRVEAYGAVDELVSWLGYARAWLPEHAQELEEIQEVLFHVGYDLATISSPPPATVTGDDVRRLEEAIDRLEAGLPPIRQFLLPGGSPRSALLHVARSVCRRAERRIVALRRTCPVNDESLRYVNRLSDYLFVLSREVQKRDGAAEVYVAWRR